VNVTHLGLNKWTFFQDLEYLGIPMGTRMTICRDSLGRLFVHSPNKLKSLMEKRYAELEKSGTIKKIQARCGL
jgi:hypothetical protein